MIFNLKNERMYFKRVNSTALVSRCFFCCYFNRLDAVTDEYVAVDGLIFDQNEHLVTYHPMHTIVLLLS